MNFKLKSMSYRFQPVHVPGKKHVVPDTLSRRSDSPAFAFPRIPREPPPSNNVLPAYENTFGPPNWVAEPSISTMYADPEELYLANSIASFAGIHDPPLENQVITWEMLRSACTSCPEYVALHKLISQPDRSNVPSSLKTYAKVIPELTTLDSIVMLNNRIVIVCMEQCC